MRSPMGSLTGKQLMESLSRLYPVLERFAEQRFGSAVTTAGWRDFSRWGAAAIAHEKESYQSAYLAWWLFAWLPDDEGLTDEAFLTEAPDHAIAKEYLILRGTELSEIEQRVIDCSLTSPYSFYLVLSIDSGTRLRVQDIYTQRQVMVDVETSTVYAQGEIVFSAVLSVDGVSVLLGCMPQALSVNHQNRIETHREKWCSDVGTAIDRRLLYLHDTELRRYYFLLLSRQQQATLH